MNALVVTTTTRSRRHAQCCDIYDATRKMDAADANMPTYIVDPVGIDRLPKYGPEDLNVVAIEQRIHDLEKRYVTLDATLTVKMSHLFILFYCKIIHISEIWYTT